MPVLVAPTAFHRMAHPDGEPATARAAAAVGTIMCLSTIATSTPAEVAAAAPEGQRWFQLYVFRDRGVTNSLIDQAAEYGLRRDRAHGRCAAPGTARAGSPHRLPGARGRRRPERLRSGRWLDGRDPARRSRVDRSDAHLEGPRAAGGRLAAAGDRQGNPDRGGRCTRLRARRRRDRRLEPRRPAARRRRAHRGAAARDGRGGGRADRGARRRRHPPRQRRGHGARARRAGGARRTSGSLGAAPHAGEQGARHVLELLRDETELTLALCGCTSPDAVTEAHVRRIGGP